MPLLDTFVSNLRMTCTRNQLSQAELARTSGIHKVTISRLFNKQFNPSLELCERLALAAGMTDAEKLFKKVG